MKAPMLGVYAVTLNGNANVADTGMVYIFYTRAIDTVQQKVLHTWTFSQAMYWLILYEEVPVSQ